MRLDNRIVLLIQEYREREEESTLFRHANKAIWISERNWSEATLQEQGRIMQFLVDMVGVFQTTLGHATSNDLYYALEHLAHVRGSFNKANLGIEADEYVDGLYSEKIYSAIRAHPINDPRWRNKEESLEEFIYDIEEHNPYSHLGRFISSVVKKLQGFRDARNQDKDVSIDSLVEDIGNIQGRRLHTAVKLVRDFIQYKIPLFVDQKVYAKINHGVIMDEIYVLAYLLGMLPITIDEKSTRLRIAPQDNLDLLTIKSSKDGYDIRLNNLQMRIVQRAARKQAPNYWDITQHTARFGRVKTYHERELNRFRDFHMNSMGAAFLTGEDYLTGRKELWKDENGNPIRIGPMENLEELTFYKIDAHRRENPELWRLRTWLLENNTSWDVYLRRLGKRKRVVKFHGRPLYSGDFDGRYSKEEDRELLKLKVLGQIPVPMSDGTKKYLKKPEDLYVLIPYCDAGHGGSKVFREVLDEIADQQLIGAFRRTYERHIKTWGPTPTEYLDGMLRDRKVRIRYGPNRQGTFLLTHQDVYTFAAERKIVLQLRDIIIKEFQEADKETALAELRPYRNQRNLAIYKSVIWYQLPSKIGRHYYDLLEKAALEPTAATVLAPYLEGKPLTRYDINPQLRKTA